jgi:hypothetical protein
MASRIGLQDSRLAFATSNAPNSSAANATVSDDGRYVPLLVLVAVLAGGALVLSLMAYREASIATMRVEGMTRAMIAHGIKDTYPHVPSEPP